MGDKVVRLLFQFEREYSGSATFISGNSLRHALSTQIDSSVGIFTESEKLTPPKSYNEYFLIRTKKCFLFPYHDRGFDRKEQKPYLRWYFMPRYITFDVANPPEDLIDVIRANDLIQLGGRRQCAHGIVTLRDWLEIDLDDFSMPDQATHLTLVSPWMYVEKFVDRYDCRYSSMRIWNHGHVNDFRIIGNGQFFRIKSEKNIQRIARKGILRKHLFHQFGMGEFQVHDWGNGGGKN